MNAQVDPAKSHRIMVTSVITAAVAVTLCALVAIAYMMNWLPMRLDVATPASMASPGQQAAGTAPGVALLPGETLVTTPEPPSSAIPAPPPPAAPGASLASPAPSTPRYARTAPPVAPAPRDPNPETAARMPEPAARMPAPSARMPEPAARTPASVPAETNIEPTPRTSSLAPKEPSYARAAPQRSVCANCGTVTATTAYSDSWEVRVRFEDGAIQTFRYNTPPNHRIGQRVRLEDNRLVRY